MISLRCSKLRNLSLCGKFRVMEARLEVCGIRIMTNKKSAYVFYVSIETQYDVRHTCALIKFCWVIYSIWLLNTNAANSFSFLFYSLGCLMECEYCRNRTKGSLLAKRNEVILERCDLVVISMLDWLLSSFKSQEIISYHSVPYPLRKIDMIWSPECWRSSTISHSIRQQPL